MASTAQNHDIDALRNLRACVEEGSVVLAFDKTYAFLSDRRRGGFSQSLEDLVAEFLRLCVDARDGKKARDILLKFRQCCQPTNFESLGRVILGFIKHAEQRAAKAAAEARQQHTGLGAAGGEADEEGGDAQGVDAVGDAAAEGDTHDDAVEAQVLHVVSGDVTRDRAERTILQPWTRYLSEVFSIAFYTYRRTVQLERELHTEVYKRCFEFCRTYRRPADLRRLVTEIDNQWKRSLQNAAKEGDSTSGTLTMQDVQILFLGTRFVQLETATALDLWGDVARAVESIHDLLSLQGKAAAPFMGKFYLRLAGVFWTCRDTLFHAIAQVTYTSLFLGVSKAREVDSGDREAAYAQACSQATLAALAVPFWLPHCVGSRGTHSVDHAASREREQTQRLTRLLGKTAVPTRASLHHDVEARGFLARSDPAVRRVFHAVEGEGVDALPLEAAIVAYEATEELANRAPELTQYRGALLEVAAVRVLQHVSGVYSRVRISWLLQLLPHLNGSAEAVENIVTQLTANNCIGFRARVHQDTGTIAFPPAALRSDALVAAAAFVAHGIADAAARVPPPKQEEWGLINPSALQLTAAKAADYSDKTEEREHTVFRIRRQRMHTQQKDQQKKREKMQDEVQRLHLENEERRKQDEAQRQEEETRKREARRQAEEEKVAEEVRRKLVVDAVTKAKGASARVKELEKKVKTGVIADTTQLASELKSVLIKEHEEEDRRRADERLRLDYLVRQGFLEEADLLRAWIRRRTEVSEEQLQEARARARKQWENDVEMKGVLVPIKQSLKDYKDAMAMRRMGGGVGGGVRR